MFFICVCSLAVHGVDLNVPLGVIDGGVPIVPLEDEFLTMFPKKSIHELHETAEVNLLFLILY